MRQILLTLFLFTHTFLFAEDYDCVVVGTSPTSIFEALYQSATGKKVLLVEGTEQCGGAWQTIDKCGIANVDVGCHHIGGNKKLADFLRDYTGCQIVSMSDAAKPYDQNQAPTGLYFSQGCYELMESLNALLKNSTIDLRLNCHLNNVSFESEWAILDLETQERHRAKKVYYTQASTFAVENRPPTPHRYKFCHLYLLVEDDGPVRFSYRSGFYQVSRIMNLTPFVGLTGCGMQMIVLQVHGEQLLSESEMFFKEMKAAGIVSDTARLLQYEPYIYEQGHCGGEVYKLPTEKRDFFEFLETSLFTSMAQYIERWKTALTKWN